MDCPVSSEDRIAYELAGENKTEFCSAKEMDIEDVYKQLFIMKEKADEKRAQQPVE